MLPGLKFSATTSAVAHSLRASAAPSGLRRSTPMLFLFRLNMGKKPAPAPSSRREWSPSIGSSLITSAPRSASTMPQVGPITMWVNSTTRRPFSGWGVLLVSGMRGFLLHRAGQARLPDRAVGRFAFQPVRDLGAQREQLVEVQPRRYAHAVQHVGEVFGGDVAAGAGCMRAAANAGRAGVEAGDAQLQRRVDVGQAEATRIVEMAGHQLVARDAQHALEQARDHRR